MPRAVLMRWQQKQPSVDHCLTVINKLGLVTPVTGSASFNTAARGTSDPNFPTRVFAHTPRNVSAGDTHFPDDRNQPDAAGVPNHQIPAAALSRYSVRRPRGRRAPVRNERQRRVATAAVADGNDAVVRRAARFVQRISTRRRRRTRWIAVSFRTRRQRADDSDTPRRQSPPKEDDELAAAGMRSRLP